MSNQEIVTVAFKHNGKVHRTWYQTYLIEDNDDYVAVGSTHSFVIEADGRKWHAVEPAVSIFMKKKWFVFLLSRDLAAGCIIMIYDVIAFFIQT